MRKKIGMFALIIALVALGSAAGASASLAPGQFKNSSKFCKALEKEMGDDAFAQAFGTNANKRNAFGKCVSKKGVLPEASVPSGVEPPLPVSAFDTTQSSPGPDAKHADKQKK